MVVGGVGWTTAATDAAVPAQEREADSKYETESQASHSNEAAEPEEASS